MIATGLHAAFEEYLAEPERLLENIDQRRFYKHLKSTVGLEGTKGRTEHFIRDEDGTLLGDNTRTHERWSGFYHKLLNARSLELDHTTIGLLQPRRLKLSLGDEPSMDKITEERKPSKAAIPFRGQNYLDFECFVPKTGLQFYKGFIPNLFKTAVPYWANSTEIVSDFVPETGL